MAAIKIFADKKENRLYLKLSGYFKLEQVLKANVIVKTEVKKLGFGFDVINDVSECYPIGLNASNVVQDTMQFIMDNGCSWIARVIANAEGEVTNTVTNIQVKTISKKVGYIAFEVNSKEEGLNKLNSYRTTTVGM